MGTPEIQTVLLDMGGVILKMAGGRGFPHSRLDWRGRQAMLRALAKHHGRANLEDLDRLVFVPWHQEYERREETGKEAAWAPHLERLRSRCGGEISDLDLLEQWFRPYGEQLVAAQGAQEALERIRIMGLNLALVSNVPLPGELYIEVMKRQGLHAPFQTLCFSYDRDTRKPSPALLRLAMAELGAEPGTSIMVGDRRDRDIAAGQFAGTRTVWIRGGDDRGPEADFAIGSIADLPDLLVGWQG